MDTQLTPIRTDTVPLLQRPEYLALRARPRLAPALKFAAEMMGDRDEDRLDWAQVVRYPVVVELRARYIEAADAGRLARSTARSYFGALRTLAPIACGQGHIDEAELRAIRQIPEIPVASDTHRRDVLSAEDFQRALTLCAIDGTEAYRRATGSRKPGSHARGLMVAAMLLVLRTAMARSVELARLKWEDVDWERGELHLVGKGLRSRRVAVPADTMLALRAWRDHVGHGQRDGDRVFRQVDTGGNPTASPATPASIQKQLVRLAHALACKALTSHTVGRRSGATYFKSAGLEDSLIVDLAGWSSPAMLKTYDQSATDRWRDRWQDDDLRAGYIGVSTPARKCLSCGEDISELRSDARTCRAARCRKSYQRALRAMPDGATLNP